ncbi:MAG TPA: peptidylprolyl isomerase, partial [Planctomycetota bacterium]|nr:peptidylprolyl isomerase [Planctomycetota bacterium]
MLKHFRRYEKYIFWVVVVVILPTFSITGIMASQCGRPSAPAVGTLFGEEVKREEWDGVHQRLASFMRVQGADQFREEDVWNFLMLLRKADQAGMAVSDREVADRVRDMFKRADAYRRAIDKFRSDKTFQNFRNQQFAQQIVEQWANENMKTAVFDPNEYFKALENAQTRPAEFEQTLRDVMRIEKLEDLVRAEGKPDPEKVWERYQEDYHRRKAEVVAFRAEAFSVTEAAVTRDELKKYYDRYGKQKFEEPKKVAIEWVLVPTAPFEATTPQPTDQELQQRYELVKERYRQVAPPAPAPVTGSAQAATPTATVQFRPFADVKDELSREVRRMRLVDAAKRRAIELRGEAANALAAGAPVSLTAVAAKQPGAVYGHTPGRVELIDLVSNEEPYRHIQSMVLNPTVDRLEASGPKSLSEVLENRDQDGAFFIRCTDRRDRGVPPFDEIEGKVRDSYVNGLDSELLSHYTDNLSKYKVPGKASLDYVFVPYAKFEKQVPADVTGTARTAALRKKAEDLIEDIRKDLSEKTAGGEKRDVDSVSMSKGAPSTHVEVEKSGKDLPADIKSTELAARLEQGTADKPGELSPVFENDAKTGVFAYVLRELKPEKTLAFAEVKEKIRREVQDEHSYERARDAADAFVKEVQPKPAEFRARAQKMGLKVVTTDFLSRKDEKPKIEGVRDPEALLGRIFTAREVGDVGGPVQDFEGHVSYAFRYVAKEPAPADGFAAKEKDIREELLPFAGEEHRRDWMLQVKLEARSVDDAVLKEVYGLEYGPEGLAQVEAEQIYVAPDAETIKNRMEADAKRQAEQAIADIKAGARFEDVARKRSQDPGSKRKGGDLGWFGHGQMVKPFEEAAFALKVGDMSGPVKSDFGYHVILLTDRKPDGSQVRARHILFRSERKADDQGELPPLDPETKKLAMEKALEKAKKAEARLAAGEEFAVVAKELSDDPLVAEKRSYDYDTAFERAVAAATPNELSQVVTVSGPEGEEHHLILVEEVTPQGQPVRKGAKPRLVRHIMLKGDSGKKRLESIREDLVERRAALERDAEQGKVGGGGRSVASEFRKSFEATARRRSEAPSSVRGGKIGIFKADPDIEKWGPAFRDALYSTKEGERSGIVEGKEGYHIVRVVSRKKKTFDEARNDVADGLLERD